MTLEGSLDAILMLTVLLVAYRAIHAPNLFGGIVLYIAFGLLLSLVWVRLEAPDLALAEAAIGAGITGALLLEASGQLGSGSGDFSPPPWRRGIAAALAAGGLGAVLVGAFLSFEEPITMLPLLVTARLPETGVDHPVTAVLLNYRAYDTWLEVGVLLVAALGVLALRTARTVSPVRDELRVDGITLGAIRLLAPFALLIGGYLLWRGTHAPGGAFQAGAVIGAVAILFILVGRIPAVLLNVTGVRLLLLLGFVVFIVGGLVGLPRGGAFLEFPATAAGVVILMIEGAVTVSIATTLALLFAGARPERPSSQATDR